MAPSLLTIPTAMPYCADCPGSSTECGRHLKNWAMRSKTQGNSPMSGKAQALQEPTKAAAHEFSTQGYCGGLCGCEVLRFRSVVKLDDLKHTGKLLGSGWHRNCVADD